MASENLTNSEAVVKLWTTRGEPGDIREESITREEALGLIRNASSDAEVLVIVRHGRGNTTIIRDRRAWVLERVRSGALCVYCGLLLVEPVDGASRETSWQWPELDHIIPLAKGGSSLDENLALCCRRCNSRKGRRTPHEAGISSGGQR